MFITTNVATNATNITTEGEKEKKGEKQKGLHQRWFSFLLGS